MTMGCPSIATSTTPNNNSYLTQRSFHKHAFRQTNNSTMSLIQGFFGGRRSNVFDPFLLDVWDPFEGFPFSNSLANVPSSARETSAFANTQHRLEGDPTSPHLHSRTSWNQQTRSQS
ncbi:hypothetical protein IC582_023691 [Cucumis melo]